ncbi:hypothetical protein N658DRAFT_257012 [Parathielavia hyrcaniae]|uniref:Uncharacterized protein n=1 Tax=Parathielavia hyrcaniae TaxID=113614 RepID=A0AAN6PUE7_9PEZI|nr:hypothetical protein N658DRAFT_257012 [Parathielavia hyrcaniae]
MPPPSAPRRTRRVVAMGFNAYSAPLSEPKLPAKPAQLKPVSQPSARYQRGGTSNMTQPTMTPMQHLSQECQRRGFNPAWVIKEVRGNAITCAVKLRDMTIHGDETYRCSMTAKYAVAMKALPIVRNWPISSSEVGQQYRRYHAERTVVNEERRALARVAPKIEQGTVMADVPAVDGRGAIATRIASRDHNLDSAAEQAEVLDQVRRMARGALPGHALGNGESARIFLEGLVAGVRAARLFEPGARARSRSPASGSRSSASYRERSTPTRPPSGYRNLDAPPAGDPPLQSMDLYPRGRRDPNLPNSDRYRPDYASIAPRYASNGPSEKEWAHDKFRP